MEAKQSQPEEVATRSLALAREWNQAHAALVVRESLRMAEAQEISHLQIFSDNSTLIGSVNKKTHMKDFTGIIKDIHSLSSVFVLILCLHIPHKKTQEADCNTPEPS
ncbi:hypothetical protein F2Q70_00016949 [Brassica cretica]|uniref:RNase H type-1 domain-containing protein n=1 Tax=Brassica cretica TaxID=69181 RepID=A0A8S9HVN5_BRACR|nr:hypothetical protein F2Q70_00016949 [Brassica cretica]